MGLAVKRAFAFILYDRFPTGLRRTFVLLRYSLGEDRWSPPYMVLAIVNGAELEPQYDQGGISRLAPIGLDVSSFKASHLSYTSQVKKFNA